MARAIRPKGLNTDPWEALKSYNPDIALLQEVTAPPKTIGGHFHYRPTTRGWGTGIWSRYSFDSLSEIPDVDNKELSSIDDALAGYICGAKITLPKFGQCTFISIHAYPSKVDKKYLRNLDKDSLKTENAKEVWPGDLIWWLTRKLPKSTDQVLIGGDWNTSILFDKIYGPRGNLGFFRRMKATGWYDALKKFSDQEIQTYFKSDSAPYQLDHIFLTEKLYNSLKDGRVQSSNEFLMASDHAPVILLIE